MCNMIIVVCFVCLMFNLCHTYHNGHHKGQDDNKIYMRVQRGAQVMLECKRKAKHWDFKPCQIDAQGKCNHEKDGNNKWSKILSYDSRVVIKAAKTKDTGVYRCKENGQIRRTFMVYVIPYGYSGSPPHIEPLKTSNLTNQANMVFTVLCNVTSKVPPAIFWFKSCYGKKCDIKLDNKTCSCHLTSSISSYNTSNIYISKFSIFNARDVDSGIYTCLAMTQFGDNIQNVTITVPVSNFAQQNRSSMTLLFLIPALFIVISFINWLCCH